MKNISIYDLIVCTFDTQFSCITGTALTLAGDVVVIGNGLGTNESALKVGMDDAGSLRCA